MEAFEMLKVAFGGQTVAKAPAFEWFVEFRIHTTTVEDDNIAHREYNIILVSYEVKLFVVSPLSLHSLLTLH